MIRDSVASCYAVNSVRSCVSGCLCVSVCQHGHSWTVSDIIVKFQLSKMWSEARTSSKMAALQRSAARGWWF